MTTLLSAVKLLDISKLPGEDVSDAVSLINGTYEYLKNLVSIDASEKIPKTFKRDILRVLQTTSNTNFNLFFQTMEAQENKDMILYPHKEGIPVEDILQCATSEYTDCLTNGTWDGVKHKQNETKSGGFTAGTGGTRKCFNCDDPNHMLDKCPKVRDEAKIKARRAEIKQANTNNKSKKKTTGKWAPPTDAEKRNRNKRTIDGKPMFYHYKTKRWMPDKFANEANLADASTPTPPSAPTGAPTPAPPTGAPTTGGTPQPSAAELNAFQSFRTMMQAFREE